MLNVFFIGDFKMAGNTIAMYIDEEVAQRLFEIKKKHGKDHNITSASKLASVILFHLVDYGSNAALDIWDKSNG